MPPTPSEQKPPSNSFLKYSGFAFQLLGGIGVAGWLGYKLDKYLGLDFPIFMLSFVVLMFAGMLFQMYRQLNKE